MSINFNASVQPRRLVACDVAFFAKDAVDLARFLLGKYFFCPKSEVGLLGIIETKAYPVDDEVNKDIFEDEEYQRPIPDRTGVLFMQKGFTRLGELCSWDYLYVTAKGTGEAGALRPVVLIRSCMPEFTDFGMGPFLTNRAAIIAKIEHHLGYNDSTPAYFRENLLINAYNVAATVRADFKSPNPSDPTLHTNPGCCLVSSTDPRASGPMLCRQRVLQDPDQTIRLQINGVSSMLRFVLDVAQKRLDFAERDALVPCRAD